jgi:hypothetical protein
MLLEMRGGANQQTSYVCLSAILFGFDWKFFSVEDESARSA